MQYNKNENVKKKKLNKLCTDIQYKIHYYNVFVKKGFNLFAWFNVFYFYKIYMYSNRMKNP